MSHTVTFSGASDSRMLGPRRESGEQRPTRLGLKIVPRISVESAVSSEELR